MKIIAVSALFCAFTAQASDRLPADVGRFIEQRETCDHFRGEIPDPEDTERMNEVLRQIELSCRSADRKLARLKKKYSRNASVQARLRTFEPLIEPDSNSR